jgi:hypothetical protein
LEVLPNHAGPHYKDIQQLLLNTGLTLEQAIQSLNDSWTQACDEQVQAWDQQVIDDNNAAKEAQHLHQEEKQLRLQQEQQDIENKQLEAEKKKPKMNDHYGQFTSPHVLRNMPCAASRTLSTSSSGT